MLLWSVAFPVVQAFNLPSVASGACISLLDEEAIRQVHVFDATGTVESEVALRLTEQIAHYLITVSCYANILQCS
jgi:hypothetical protein